MLRALQRMLGQHDWNHDPKPLTAWQRARLLALGDSKWAPLDTMGTQQAHHGGSSAVSKGQSKQAPRGCPDPAWSAKGLSEHAGTAA